MEEEINKGQEDYNPTLDEPSIVIIPMKIPENVSSESLSNSLDIVSSTQSSQDPNSRDSDTSGDDLSIEEQLSQSMVSFHTVSDNPSETVSYIEESTGISSDESLENAARCGAFWKSLGAETLIYMSSYGAGILANGLIIRFAGLDSFVGTVLFGTYSALSYNQARILFTSAMHPPRDTVPEDRRETFQILSKYAFLPLSWVVRGGTAGFILSLIGDASFGVQQAVSVPSSLLVGPVGTGMRAIARDCMGGEIDLDPDYEKFKDVCTGFETAYSEEPNPVDRGRTYRYGTVRDALVRGLVMNLGTIAYFAYQGNQIATFCIGGGDEFRNATMYNNSTDVNDLLNEHCWGGQFTYLFRELGLSFTYGLGVLVVEPLLVGLVNKVYDCFYPRNSESESSDDDRFEEVNSSDEDPANMV